MAKKKDPFRPAERKATCPKCGSAFAWNVEDGLGGQSCACGYVFTGRERKKRPTPLEIVVTPAMRAERLADWFRTDGASWLRTDIERVTTDTEHTRGKGEVDFKNPDRYVIVERLELPGHGNVIVSFHETMESAEQTVAYLFGEAADTSWCPAAVIDLDTGDTLSWTLTVKLAARG